MSSEVVRELRDQFIKVSVFRVKDEEIQDG